MLTIRGLVKSYASARTLDNVDLDVAAGEIVGLIGPNGAGKSTLLHCICGITTHDRGRTTVAGADAASREAKRQLGFIPDTLELPAYLSGREYLRLTAKLRPPFDDEVAQQLARTLGIEPDLGQLIGTYSHGMCKKLQLVGELARRPRVLLLDEPFGGLDPEVCTMLEVILRQLADHRSAILVSTHDMTLAEHYFDRLAMVDHGRIVLAGTPAEIRNRLKVSSVRLAYTAITAPDRDLVADAKRLAERIVNE